MKSDGQRDREVGSLYSQEEKKYIHCVGTFKEIHSSSLFGATNTFMHIYREKIL